ncbi:MAG: hypothetical protein FJ086_03040 [Deltaproteobacteria bacterium]|nr:hypothetical protein [Deltaproteobacteria bacterium]
MKHPACTQLALLALWGTGAAWAEQDRPGPELSPAHTGVPGVQGPVQRTPEEEGWELLGTDPVPVRSRTRPGSSIRDLWAEGELDVPAQDIQAALMDNERYPSFMPYCKESRFVGQTEPDGGRTVYTRLELPFVAPRDYVVKVNVLQVLSPDGRGAFRNQWAAVPDYLPERSGTVRLRTNDGSWTVLARGPVRSYVVYRFAVDPGGMLPAFAANMANRTGVRDTLRAVQKEALRRMEMREAEARRRAPR